MRCSQCGAHLSALLPHDCDYLAFARALEGIELDETERRWLRWLAKMDSRKEFLGLVSKIRREPAK